MDISRREWAASLAVAGLGCAPDREEATALGTASGEGAHSAPHVIDLHCDTPMLLRDGTFDIGLRNDRGEVDIPRMRDGGITAVFFSVYTSPTRNTELESVREALEIIDTVLIEAGRYPEDVVIASSTGQIESAKRSGQIAILLGIEGGHMIGSSLGVLRTLYRLGARYLTLTHSRNTAWAGSSGEEDDAGLSDFGREVVAEMNRLGMMVDVSHVSDRTFWDVLEASRAPVIASHSSARALASHKRNMTDEMIRATAERGGVVHVNYYNTFLDDGYAQRSRQWESANPGGAGPQDAAARRAAKLEAIGRPPLDTLLDHFEHVARVGGVEAVGLGSDFDGVDGELPAGMEDISKVPAIAEGLAGRGFSNADVEQVMGKNTLRVFRDIESAAGTPAGA